MDARGQDFLELCHVKYNQDPVGFAEDIVGIKLTKQQSDAINALALSPKHQVAIKSGHGVGKSCMLSIAILWFLCTKPFSKIICTAPSSNQLYNTMMSEIELWYNTSLLKDLDLLVFTKDHVRLNHSMFRNNWFLAAVSVSNPENISGSHAENILAVVDEGAGVHSDIFERLEGVLTTDNSYMITTGNPSFTSGYFYDIFNNPEYSKQYDLFTFSCLDSENVDEEWVEYMKDKYGENSPIYKVRVLGEFASMEETVIINRTDVKRAIGRNIPEQDIETTFIGVDISSGESNDFSTICVRQGYQEIERLKVKMKLRNFKEELKRVVRKYYAQSSHIVVNIDTTGLGIQLGQDIEDYFYNYRNIEINKINFSYAAIDRKTYGNAFTEMFFRLREIIENISLLHKEDSEIEEDLGSRRYDFDRRNRYIAERKREFVKRFNRSPDEGDAILLAFYDTRDSSVLFESYIDKEEW